MHNNECGDWLPLLATCWTTAGDAGPFPGQHVSPFPLRARIEAASRAGFVAVGLLDFDLHKFLAHSTLRDLRLILHDNGMTHTELEFLTRWWTTGEERRRSNEDRAFLFAAAEELEAHHIKVAADLNDLAPPDVDLWALELHALGADAASHGTRVALELMPFSNVANLGTALQIVRAADHPAAGLLLDIWHLERSGANPSDIADIPLALIHGVELDDGSAVSQGDPYDDTCLRRQLPGTGDFRVVEFAAALLNLGWNLPWGIEMLNAEYRLLPLDQGLAGVVSHTQEVLALAKATV
jgi:sugar phosphate isomerase/epimerase